MTEQIKLFDSHCHLDMEEYEDDLDAVLHTAADAGVTRILLAACDERSSNKIAQMASRKNTAGVDLLVSAGVHPHEAESVAKELPDELVKLSRMPETSAIGEIGLDFYYDNSPRVSQRTIFEQMFDLAVRACKPVLIHLRNAKIRSEGDAYGEAISIIKNFTELTGGVIHCFSGDKADARKALDMGFFISFAGPITYPKADELREIAVYSPADRILCETDAPYLAPQSKRGRRNEPALVREVYEKLAELKKSTLSEIAGIVWENGERLFSVRGGL